MSKASDLRRDQPVTITQAPLVEGADWATLCAAMIVHADWLDATPLTIYVESVARCGFDESSGAALASWSCPADAFEGRVFGGRADARWIRRDDGTFQAWVVREDAAGPDECNAKVTDRTYFLLGRGTAEKGVFTEARYPRAFEYPVEASVAKTPADVRAFVRVAEYEPCMPDWSAKRSEEEMIAELDQPMLAAHRFVSLGVSEGE